MRQSTAPMMKLLPKFDALTMRERIADDYRWYARGVADTLNLDHDSPSDQTIRAAAADMARDVTDACLQIIRAPGLTPSGQLIDQTLWYWELAHNEFTPERRAEWWGTDAARAVLLAQAPVTQRPLSYEATASLLGIAYGTVARAAHSGYIERHPRGGLYAPSVRNNLLRRLVVQ